MFVPGETVAQEFLIPFADTELSKVVLTYKQNNKIVLTKPISSGFEKVTETQTRITVPLSQKETLLFCDKYDYTMQLNVYTIWGSRVASKEIKGSTGTQQYKDVITNG